MTRASNHPTVPATISHKQQNITQQRRNETNTYIYINTQGQQNRLEMAAVQTSNFLPEIQHLLDTQGEKGTTALEVNCACCRQSRLDISRSVRFAPAPPTPTFRTPRPHPREARKTPSPTRRYPTERTVALPCGHVIGARCLGNMLTSKTHMATCPSCDYRMMYDCGHPIAAALIPVQADGGAGEEDGGSVRDRFPLTIPEGGAAPEHCKQCRWKEVTRRTSVSLGVECAVCRQQELAGLPHNEAEHERHRTEHLTEGLRADLTKMMAELWPDFKTRETATSAEREAADKDRRQATLSVLIAMVLSDLEETIWYRTPARGLSDEQTKRHHASVAGVRETLLEWLVNPEDSRRTW